MPEINITNDVGRDAVVSMQSVSTPLKVRWVDHEGRQAKSVRFLKSTLDHDLDSLTEKLGDISKVGAALITDDPEIDIENVGSFLSETSRVYIDNEAKIVHRIKQFEIVHNPDGTERERRPKEQTPQNVSSDSPLGWSGRFVKKADVVRKFVFANKLQLSHINGLTYDFLYGIAKELEEKESMMMLGAGPKSNQPLILRRGSVPYRGFLEGRTRGDDYILLLHLSNLEMKSPEPKDTETKAEEKEGNS